MRRALSLMLLPILLAAAPAARGAEITLKQVAPPAAYHPVHPIDVGGITPGMTPEAVAAILTPVFGPVQPMRENMGLQEQGIDVATQTYVTRITATKGTDDISVWFGTPTTGNGVVEVTLQTIYTDPAQAPPLAETRAKLIAKYGPPAFDGPLTGTGEVRLLAWSYKGDKPVPCTAPSCQSDVADGLSVADMAKYEHAVRQGHDLTVIGMLLAGINDPARTASMVVTVSDTATKLHTLDTALAQMRAAVHPSKPTSGKPTPAKPQG